MRTPAQQPAPLEGSRPPNQVGVLLKALDVLEQLAEQEELGLTELTLATSANKASVYRILTTLEHRGFVSKDPVSRKYRPGPRLIALSSMVVGAVDLVRVAKPALEDLRERFGETVNLGVLADRSVVYLAIVEGSHGLRMAARTGDRNYLHSTGLGKALLSALDTTDARDLLERCERPQLTVQTLTSIDDLLVELGRIRERGYAIDNEENEVGARCIAVPIRQRDGVPVAAISVSGPAARIEGATADLIAARLVETAGDVGTRLGNDRA